MWLGRGAGSTEHARAESPLLRAIIPAVRPRSENQGNNGSNTLSSQIRNDIDEHMQGLFADDSGVINSVKS